MLIILEEEVKIRKIKLKIEEWKKDYPKDHKENYDFLFFFICK